MITIFTPTYNRKNTLIRLANSLCSQTDKDFEWIIVDDGSKDGTYEIIDKYTKLIDIKYIYKENGGKHTAYNTAIDRFSGDLFICVDSDDYLDSKSVAIIKQLENDYHEGVGFVLPRIMKSVNDESSWKKIHGKYVNIIDLHSIFDITESNIIFRKKYLKKYKFPVFCSRSGIQEKFCPEDILYNSMTSEGMFLALNIPIYYSEYLSDGLTNKIFRLWEKNSIGVLNMLGSRYELFANYSFYKKVKNQIKCIININALCLRTKSNIIEYSPSIMYSILLFIPSVFFCVLRYK